MLSIFRHRKHPRSTSRAQIEHRELCLLHEQLQLLQSKWLTLTNASTSELRVHHAHRHQVAVHLSEAANMVERYQHYAYDRAIKEREA